LLSTMLQQLFCCQRCRFVLHNQVIWGLCVGYEVLMCAGCCACSCCAQLGDAGAHQQQDYGCQGVLTTGRLSKRQAWWSSC
jgi:hypothetical protein